MFDTVPRFPSDSLRQSQDWSLPFAFAGLIVATYLLGVVLGTLTRSEPTVLPIVFEPILYPGLFVLTPPALAALNILRDGGIPSSLAIGFVPGITFPVLGLLATLFGFGNGDSPAWALSLFFGGVGLLGALIGIGIAIGATHIQQTLIG